MEEQSLRREHGGIIWGASGSPLGSICLGVIWEHLEGLRLRRIWETFGGQISEIETPLSQNAKVAFKFQFHEAFLRVDVTK